MPTRIGGRAVSINITGAEELMDLLKTMEKDDAMLVATQAVNEATKMIVKFAKFYATRSDSTGTLVRSIGRVVKASRRTWTVSGTVGPRTGWGREVIRQVWFTSEESPRRRMPITDESGNIKMEPIYSDPAKTAHLVEHGTLDHPAGQSRARPFMRPGYDHANPYAIIKREIMAGIRRGIRKHPGSLGKATSV